MFDDAVRNLAFIRAEGLANKGGLPLGITPVGKLRYSNPERPVLVLGPSRSGKSSAFIIPSIFSNLGPVVSLSTKSDIFKITAKSRGLVGKVWIFDPTDSVDISEFNDLPIKKIRWSPLDAVVDWESALRVSNLMVASAMTVSNLEASHWNERAEALIGPLIYAAFLSKRPIKDVVLSILTRDISWAAESIDKFDSDSMAKYVLAGILTTEDRELSGIFSTAASLLKVYKSSKVLSSSVDTNFYPAEFIRSTDTLYIPASGAEQSRLAPLIVTLLDSIKAEGYKYFNEIDSIPGKLNLNNERLLFALDELGQSAKIPFLSGLVAEGGGQGITTIACFQDLSQAVAKYGTIAEGFLTLFPTKAIFAGVSDKKTVEAISTLAGEKEVEKFSLNFNSRNLKPRDKLVLKALGNRPKLELSNVTKSTGTVKVLPPNKVAFGPEESLLIIDSPSPPLYLRQNRYFNSSRYSGLIKGEIKRLKTLEPKGDIVQSENTELFR